MNTIDIFSIRKGITSSSIRCFTTVILAFACCVSFLGCKKFLSVTPRDKKVVRTVEDYRDILASYLSFMKDMNRSQRQIMGVDAYAYPVFDLSGTFSFYTGESKISQMFPHLYNKENGLYTAKAIELQCWISPLSQVWNRYYQFLGPINMILVGLDKAEGDNLNLRQRIEGEALMWQAFAYFKLLQYYAPMDNANLGIPMYLNPSEDIGIAQPSRQTQPQVYQHIISALTKVLTLLSQTPSNNWNLFYRREIAQALLASVYQWKASSACAEEQDWKLCLEYAKKAIGSRKLSSSLEELKAIFDCHPAHINNNIESNEFFVRFTDRTGLLCSAAAYRLNINGAGASGEASQDFVKLYSDTDYRKVFYFQKNEDGTILNNKYNLSEIDAYSTIYGCWMPFRVAEMYLIAAEAAFKLHNEALAQQFLNEIQTSRHSTTLKEPLTGNALLNDILNERTREFYLENDMLWLDMKRLHKKRTVTINNKTYTLEPNDFKYSLPIPSEELKLNKSLKQNPGWELYFN